MKSCSPSPVFLNTNAAVLTSRDTLISIGNGGFSSADRTGEHDNTHEKHLPLKATAKNIRKNQKAPTFVGASEIE
jgi:hypothetical protein